MQPSRRLLPLVIASGLLVSACGSSTPAAQSPSQSAAGSSAAAGSSGAAGANSADATSSAAVSAGAGQTAAEAGGTLTFGLSNDPGNLDPSMTVLSVTRTISHLAYDTLINQNADGTFVSGIASEWTVEPDSVTFTLNPDVQCSDGTTFTAADAKANIDFVSDAKNSSPLLGVMIPAGLTTTVDEAKNSITVKATAPNAFLLNGFTNVFMICKAGLDDHKVLAQKTIGTGPFELSEAVAEDHYTYKLREGYAWGPDGATMSGAGVPDTVNVRVIANPTTMANLLIAGEVNVGSVVGADAARLREANLPTIDTTAPLGEFFYNQGEGHPGTDPAVREALVTALDIAALTKVGTAGAGTPSKGLVTIQPQPCVGDTVAGNLPTFDAEKAKSLLDAAGWVPGPDGIRAKDGKPLQLKFIYPVAGGDSLAAAAELVGQMWKAVGAGVELQAVSSTQLNEVAFSTGDWDAGWVPITVSLPSQLGPFLSGPAPGDGTNFAHLNNQTYNADSKKANETGEVEPACALWNSAESALVKAFDVVPMFDAVNGTFLNKAAVALIGGELVATSLRLTTG